MGSENQQTQQRDRSVVLSTLWIFVLLNYLYADVFTILFNPAIRELAGKMSEGMVLAWAIFLETAIAMIFLCRALRYAVNRWANIIAGVVHTLVVAWSLTVETPQAYYIFFAVVEIICTLFIAWYAWRWRPQHVISNPQRLL